jgi:hypothetical protein
MKTWLLLPLLLALCAGCATEIGPVTIRPINGNRQFVLKNETGHDLSGAKTRGHIIWGGDVFAVPPEAHKTWAAGEEITTMNLRHPVSVLILHGFSPAGRFSVKWQEASRVMFDGRAIGKTAFDLSLDSTVMEVPIFGR